LNAAKLAPDCTTSRGLDDFSRVVEFLIKKITPDVRKPGKVHFSADIPFLQGSTRKVVECLFPYGLGLTKDDRISVFQSFIWQSRYMESAQYHPCPFGPQAIGNAINIRHVVGQPDDQGQLAVLPVWDRFVRLVYEADIESVWGQGSYRRKTDGGVTEQGQADSEGLVACPRTRCSGDEK
jgi:hypothetical protein